MFCKNCGTQIPDGSTTCTNCGTNLDSNANNTNQYNQFPQKIDNPSHIAGIASCCFPIVGLILYFLWKDEKPNSAKLICKWMIAGIVAWVLVYGVFILIGVLTAASSPYSY